MRVKGEGRGGVWVVDHICLSSWLRSERQGGGAGCWVLGIKGCVGWWVENVCLVVCEGGRGGGEVSGTQGKEGGGWWF